MVTVNIDESVVSQLVGMGFPFEGCRRAAYHTNGRGIEAAMEWALEHSADPGWLVVTMIIMNIILSCRFCCSI